MALLRINKNPARRQLNVFAAAWFLFVGAWSLLAWREGHLATAQVLGVIAVATPLIGLIFPTALRWLYLGLSYATFPIGLVFSYVLLGLIYFVIFTLIGLLMRLLRYDPLKRRFDRPAQTYWIPRRAPPSISSYFRQN